MDVTDLTAKAMFSCNDLLIQDHAAANTGSQCDHDQVRVAFSASLPHFAKGSYIGIISALYRNSI